MQRRQLLLLTFFAAVLVIARAASFCDLPEWDIATYSLIADELVHGRGLYTDIWDMKPPAVFYTYAVVQTAFAASPLSVYLLSVLTAVATLAAVWLVARRSSLTAAGWAGAVFVAICFEPFSAASMPNTEAFINLFLTLAWAMLLRAGGGQRGWMLVLLAGACASWASMYKHVAIAPAVLLALAHAVVPPTAIARRTAVAHALAFVAMIAAGWLLLFGWFAVTGRAQIFIQTVFVYPRYYAGGMINNLLASFTPAAWQRAPMVVIWPMLLLCLLGWVARLMQRRPDNMIAARSPRFMVLLIAMLAGAHVAVALPGQFAAHYYQLWYPALAIACGCASSSLINSLPRRQWIGHLAAALTVAAIVAPQWPWYQLPGEEWSRKRYGKLFMDARADMLAIQSTLQPHDDIYIWADEPWLYRVAGKRARYAGVWKMHCLDGPMAQRLTDTTLIQLQQNPPKLFVFWSDPAPISHPIVAWALEHYDPLPGTPTYPMRFYARRSPATQPVSN